MSGKHGSLKSFSVSDSSVFICHLLLLNQTVMTSVPTKSSKINMSKDSSAKNHHYVPQFLLKKFQGPKKGQIFVFDKCGEREFKSAIRNIASENYFNKIQLEGKEENFEPFFCKIEDKVAPVIKKITVKENLSVLSDDERSIIGYYIALQHLRTKEFRNTLSQVFEGIRTQINSSKHHDSLLLSEEQNKALSLSLLTMAKDLYPFIMDKAWYLSKTSKSNPFYISDNPVTLNNLQNHSPYGNIGFGVKGIEIYFPLSKTISLSLLCKSIEQRFRHIGTNAMAEAFDKGTPMLLKPENVTYHNSLQVMNSSRFVFSSKPDFSLVKRMLKDNPNFKTGRKIEVN